MDKIQLRDHTNYINDKRIEEDFKKQLDAMYDASEAGNYTYIFGCYEINSDLIKYLLRHDFELYAHHIDSDGWYSMTKLTDWSLMCDFLQVSWE